MCEQCEMRNNIEEIIFTLPREDFEYFKQKINEWKRHSLKLRREKEKRELTQKIKTFQHNCNIANFRTAKILYEEQMLKIENVINERI